MTIFTLQSILMLVEVKNIVLRVQNYKKSAKYAKLSAKKVSLFG